VVSCADVILSAASRRLIVTGSGGAPIDFCRRRRREFKLVDGGATASLDYAD